MLSVPGRPVPPLPFKLHAAFLNLLPQIEQHGHIYFRHVRCPHRKAELLQEMRSLGWKWFIHLNHRGKNVHEFATVFVRLLARAVNSGRRLTGQAKAKDVMNRVTQERGGFGVEAFDERLRENTVTPVPDQVQFRIDWPAWLATLTARERRIIRAMAQNERTSDLGREFEVSAARISQMRREFCDGWTRFCGDALPR